MEAGRIIRINVVLINIMSKSIATRSLYGISKPYQTAPALDWGLFLFRENAFFPKLKAYNLVGENCMLEYATRDFKT